VGSADALLVRLAADAGNRSTDIQSLTLIKHQFLWRSSIHETNGCMINYATTSDKKHPVASLPLSCSHFPATPGIPAALETGLASKKRTVKAGH
jgi:hypothetical protein